MNKTHLLFILVAAEVFAAFASMGTELFFGWTLPSELSGYAGFGSAGRVEALQILLLFVTAATTLAAWIGLVTFRRPARRLYLVSCGFWLLLILFSGPSVKTSAGAMFTAIDALTAGAILGLVYFSDLSRRFEDVERSPAIMTPHIHRA